MMRWLSVSMVALSAMAACTPSPPAPAPAQTVQSAVPSIAISPTVAPPAQVAPKEVGSGAAIGKPAPDFELRDLDGKSVKLSFFKGKVVVLEWFNPGCPFVKASHGKGSLKTAAAEATKKGVVWLAINSAAEGKQGFGVEANRAGAKTFGLTHPVLLDEKGEVGHAYGATNTPHIFVIDESGVLVYRGAPDNSPDGEGESPTGGKLVSYVDATLADLAAKRPVGVGETKAYGCSVKYGH